MNNWNNNNPWFPAMNSSPMYATLAPHSDIITVNGEAGIVVTKFR